MAEALAAVKMDLGQDAVILNTRSFKRGGLLGLGRRTVVEVTAAARDPANVMAGAAGVAQRAYSANKPRQGERANSASGERKALNGGRTAGAARSAAMTALAQEADRQRTRRLAMTMSEQGGRAAAPPTPVAQRPPSTIPVLPQTSPAATATRSAAATSPLVTNVAASAVTPGPGVANPAAGTASMVMAMPSAPSPGAAKRFILRSPDSLGKPAESASETRAGTFDDALARTEAPAPVLGRQATPAGIVSLGSGPSTTGAYAPPPRQGLRHVAIVDPDGPVREELAAIKSMVGQVLQRQAATVAHRTPSMPQAIFDQYLGMVSHDIPEDLAETIVNEVRERLSDDDVNDASRVRRAVVEHLADYLPVSPTALTAKSPNGRPLTLALVGPTGVGKTTTLAKLAASFKLKAGRKVGLITSDTYRIAAVDQLRTYANIIGLPLQVVLTPADMRQAVHALSSPGGAGGGSTAPCDVILIDTAGRSQNDTLRIAELREFIDAAHPHEVHMVLSATAGAKVLSKEASAFGSVGVNKVILTKMDEAASLGAVVALLKQINRPVSFITTGQEVPDHIETAKAQRLAELVLGGAVHA
jgi:flagellar biosynthesis protein FlhF